MDEVCMGSLPVRLNVVIFLPGGSHARCASVCIEWSLWKISCYIVCILLCVPYVCWCVSGVGGQLFPESINRAESKQRKAVWNANKACDKILSGQTSSNLLPLSHGLLKGGGGGKLQYPLKSYPALFKYASIQQGTAGPVPFLCNVHLQYSLSYIRFRYWMMTNVNN